MLKKLVKKSVCVVEFLGRGTFSTDVHRYLTGAQYNVANQISDWERVIEFLGNHLSTNISLYCKGESAAEIGLLVSLRHPYLFNASVLHVKIPIYRMDSMICKNKRA